MVGWMDARHLPAARDDQAAKLEPVIEGVHASCDTLYETLSELRLKLTMQLEEHKKVEQKREVVNFMRELYRSSVEAGVTRTNTDGDEAADMDTMGASGSGSSPDTLQQLKSIAENPLALLASS